MLPSPCFLISPVALALQTGTKISPVWRCWLLITQHVPLMKAACWEASCMTPNPALPLPPSPPRHTQDVPAGSFAGTGSSPGSGVHQERAQVTPQVLLSCTQVWGSRFPGPGSAGPDGCSGKGAAVWHWDLCCCHRPSSQCWTLTL